LERIERTIQPESKPPHPVSIEEKYPPPKVLEGKDSTKIASNKRKRR